MTSITVTLFDTETTDLIHNSGLPLSHQPRIVEIYAKTILLPEGAYGGKDEWKDVGEIEFLVNPMIPIPDESAKITGISDDMVKECPPLAEYWPQICDFFSGSDFMVAHNLAFDRDMMKIEQKRIDDRVKFPFPEGSICTVESTIHLCGHRLKLIDLYEHLFEERFEGAHRAKSDVIPMERCFKELWERGEI